MSLTPDDVRCAYRLLLDRDPESEEAIQTKLRAWRTRRELRADIMASEEFGLKNPLYAAPRERSIVIKVLATGARLFVDLSDRVIGAPIVRDAYEQSEVGFARSVVGPGDTAIDVGAHIGFYTIQLAEAVGPSGRVHAFEPVAHNADLLKLSIRENAFQDRVTLHHAAVANSGGEATLHYSRDRFNTGGGFLSSDVQPGLLSARVPILRLDDCGIQGRVRLLKVDVEGAEPFVIAGAAQLLARERPTVVCEVHPEQLARVSRSTPAKLVDQLAAFDLRPYAIADGRLGRPLTAADMSTLSTVAFT
jgi:FkbM family methyltransferase